jgi:hypothetical protein
MGPWQAAVPAVLREPWGAASGGGGSGGERCPRGGWPSLHSEAYPSLWASAGVLACSRFCCQLGPAFHQQGGPFSSGVSDARSAGSVWAGSSTGTG